MTKLSTHRLIQISNLEDTCASSASVSGRAAIKALNIGNVKASVYFSRKCQRMSRIAAKCRARLEAGA